MSQDFAKKIQRDILRVIQDPTYSRYADLAFNCENEEERLKIDRSELKKVIKTFLEGKEEKLKILCQKADVITRIYCGYDIPTTRLCFWPDEERAQVVFLAGLAAIEGQVVNLVGLICLIF